MCCCHAARGCVDRSECCTSANAAEARSFAAARPPAAAAADARCRASHDQHPAPPSALQGSPAAQQWLTALARWCEGAEGAKVKQQLSGMLRCGARSRDKLAAVTNRARQQIGAVFRCRRNGQAHLAEHISERNACSVGMGASR